MPGKGEVLWRSLLVTERGHRLLHRRGPEGVLRGLRLRDRRPAAHRSRACSSSRRCTTARSGDAAGQGGRVTELVARPLLNLHWPQLAGFVQPLGGEYAARRSLLERLPVPRRLRRRAGPARRRAAPVGLDALAQVDVGVRKHRHQDGQALGRMAAAIYRTAQLRLSRGHLVRPALTQFERGETGFVPRTHPWTRRSGRRWRRSGSTVSQSGAVRLRWTSPRPRPHV